MRVAVLRFFSFLHKHLELCGFSDLARRWLTLTRAIYPQKYND